MMPSEPPVEPPKPASPPLVLVLGASGYVGSHLVPWLAARGRQVRAAARRLEALEAFGWPGVETVAADALDPASLEGALAGVETAYYLVHSMAAGADFPRIDREAAANFRDAAARAGVRRIVYLGGLQPSGAASSHLASRGETGDVLRQGPVPVTELRAGIVIGPGSAAFEVIRDLVFHLPVMVTPRWVRSRSQPIALDDVLEYLGRIAELPQAAGQVYDAGGPEVLTYEDLMRTFARVVGRHPQIVPVPVLTPRLSSYAFAAEQAASQRQRAPGAGGGRWVEGSMLYRRERADFAFYAKRMGAHAVASAPADAVWREVVSIGGENGYYFLDALWSLRGALDCAAGGTGLKRGRRDPHALAVGDAIDFWRVASLEPGRRLMLIAEMKLPGAAALGFEVRPLGPRRTRVDVTAYFHPAGAPGLAYWHALAPAHAVIFPGLARAIARRAEAQPASRDEAPSKAA
ncbi:MAG: SDR family oxidoreductase [Burkholderiaceae bacterium]|nr:SDR family oxidoreductase [Burkholderiaceae bacterium]